MPLNTWGQLAADAPESATTFELLPDGPYDVRITKAELTKSGGGKVGYNVTLTVEGGAYANRTLFNTWYISPESPTAMGIFFRQMTALGLPKNEYFVALEPSDEKVVADLLNRRFKAIVGTRIDKNGAKKQDVKNVQPPSGPAPVVSSGPTASLPTPTATVPATPVATPTAAAPVTPSAPVAPAAPADPWGSINSTPAAPTAPATPVAPPLPPLGPGNAPF